MKTNENLENHMVLNTADAPWNQPDADEPTPEEKAEAARIEARDKAAAEFADGLHQLADLIEENPEMALPYYGRAAALSFMCHDRATFAATVRAFGKGKKVENSIGPATLDFIPEFPLNIKVHGFRDGIGCRRVVKGTQTIPAVVIPARPEQVIPAHEEEIVEWECGSILESEMERARR